MSWPNDYSDVRLTSSCLYCGGEITSREHVPSRVLLDDPLPPDLPVVGACQPCNESYSKDEEYVACLLECILSGSTEPTTCSRPNIAKKLANQPALRARLEKSKREVNGQVEFVPEHSRIVNVIKKLAQGHVLYELSEVFRGEPTSVFIHPIDSLSPEQRSKFETIELPTIWPEIGCRMMFRLVEGNPLWQVIQPQRYRYATIFGGPTIARMVLSEYLACEVVWED